MKIVDMHLDLPDIYQSFGLSVEDFFGNIQNNPLDLLKIKDAAIEIMGISLYFDSEFLKTDYYDGVMEYYNFCMQIFTQSQFEIIKNSNDLNNMKEDNTGVVFSLEGLECVRTLNDFYQFFELGLRIWAFTWRSENIYACGRKSKIDEGLSLNGKELLTLMSENKLIIDLAHLSKKSVLDIEKQSNLTLVNSHANVASVFENSQNLSDDEIQIIVDRGGIVSLFPLKAAVGKDGTFDEFYNHIDYIASKWGHKYIGISSDMYPLDEYPFLHGYKDVTIMKAIKEYLLTRLDSSIVQDIMYNNWKNVLLNNL